jgi:transcriptional regulator with XRE-family HTH domain
MRLHDDGRELLAELMEIRKDSHRKVAAAAGWSSHSFVGRLLSGQANSVKPRSAVLLARYFGLPVHRFFDTELSVDDVRPAPRRQTKKAA